MYGFGAQEIKYWRDTDAVEQTWLDCSFCWEILGLFETVQVRTSSVDNIIEWGPKNKMKSSVTYSPYVKTIGIRLNYMVV